MGSAPSPGLDPIPSDSQTGSEGDVSIYPDNSWNALYQKARPPYSPDKVTYLILGVTAVFIAATLFTGMGEGRPTRVFRYLYSHLPLTLPILSLLLATLLRPQKIFKPEGFLELSNPLSLGLVSFAIWYLVTAQNSPHYIKINDNGFLNTDYAVLVCMVSFIFAGFCSVVTALAQSRYSRRGNWMFLQFVLVVLAIAMLRLPFGLLQNKAEVEKEYGVSLDVKFYTVVIPFRDAALNSHLGTSAQPIQQSIYFKQVSAKTVTEARSLALERFKNSESNRQFVSGNSKSKDLSPKTVEILESGIAVQEETK